MRKICGNTTDIRQLAVKLISEGKKQIPISSNNFIHMKLLKFNFLRNY